VLGVFKGSEPRLHDPFGVGRMRGEGGREKKEVESLEASLRFNV